MKLMKISIFYFLILNPSPGSPGPLGPFLGALGPPRGAQGGGLIIRGGYSIRGGGGLRNSRYATAAYLRSALVVITGPQGPWAPRPRAPGPLGPMGPNAPVKKMRIFENPIFS